MACMCGDTQCWSCGPAQGNVRCPICGSWADNGCDHLDEETGDIKPEYEQQAAEIAEAERRREDEFYEDYARDVQR